MSQINNRPSRPIGMEEAHYWKNVRQQFMIDSEEVYLNTGSWGSLPRSVFQAVVDDLQLLEKNPTRNRNLLVTRLNDARQRLGNFVNAPDRDIALVPNVTVAINMVVHGQDWKPGDEILASDQEYGAIDNCLHFAEQRFGIVVNRAAIPIPPNSPEAIVSAFEQALTPRTKLVLCSHITTRTGLITPIRQLSDLAHAHGALIAFDGAHGPGMVPLELENCGCDFYGGNCHKWLCAPKGTGFLYARPEVQEKLHHLIVSWGYSKTGHQRAENGALEINNQPYMWQLEYWGTRDMAGYGAVSEAVEVQEKIGKTKILARGQQLSQYVRQRLLAFDWVTEKTPDHSDMSGSITTFHYSGMEQERLVPALYDQYRITTPIFQDSEGVTQRISTHIYNTCHEIDILVDALQALRA